MSPSNNDRNMKDGKKMKQEDDESNNHRKKKGFKKLPNPIKQQRFKGDCKELAGHI